MYENLRNKVALITGSTSGIGLAVAHVLAKQGINLVLHGLVSEDEGQTLAASFAQQYQIQTCFSAADLQDAEAITQLITYAEQQLGNINILVNNAGIQYTANIEDFPTEKWHAVIATNLTAAFLTTQQVLPNMKSNGWGRIINIASVHGLVASKQKAAYVASKHGIVGLTKVAALECAEQGITANAICPGWVDTPLITNQIAAIAERDNLSFEAAKYQLITEKQPLPEMVDPSAIGQLILFLCGDAGKAITGASLPIDGAWTTQ